VLQCAACNTDVQLSLQCVPDSSCIPSTLTLTKVAGLASWLVKHGALVRSMAFPPADEPDWQTVLDCDSETCIVSEATVQLLCQAMQQAGATRGMHLFRAPGHTASIEAAAAAAAATWGTGPLQG
jgi:hypothetical protein